MCDTDRDGVTQGLRDVVVLVTPDVLSGVASHSVGAKQKAVKVLRVVQRHYTHCKGKQRKNIKLSAPDKIVVTIFVKI